MEKKTVLVTGASGFIGANFVRMLLGKNNIVHILLRSDSNIWRIQNILSSLHTHTINYSRIEEVKKIIHKIAPQYIYHFASYGGYPFQNDVDKMIYVNIFLAHHLLEALQDIPYELIVFIGSSSEYGYNTKPMSEQDILEPTSFYAATKASGTYISQVYAKVYKKPIVIFRPFSVYGPYEEPTRLIPTTILSCMKNEEVLLTNGEEKRDFIYIDDFNDALLQVNELKKLPGQIINIGSGQQYSTREVVTTIHSLLNSNSILKWGRYPNRSWDSNFWQANIEKARKYLKWKLQNTMPEGLKKTISWFQKNKKYYEKNK